MAFFLGFGFFYPRRRLRLVWSNTKLFPIFPYNNQVGELLTNCLILHHGQLRLLGGTKKKLQKLGILLTLRLSSDLYGFLMTVTEHWLLAFYWCFCFLLTSSEFYMLFTDFYRLSTHVYRLFTDFYWLSTDIYWFSWQLILKFCQFLAIWSCFLTQNQKQKILSNRKEKISSYIDGGVAPPTCLLTVVICSNFICLREVCKKCPF